MVRRVQKLLEIHPIIAKHMAEENGARRCWRMAHHVPKLHEMLLNGAQHTVEEIGAKRSWKMVQCAQGGLPRGRQDGAKHTVGAFGARGNWRMARRVLILLRAHQTFAHHTVEASGAPTAKTGQILAGVIESTTVTAPPASSAFSRRTRGARSSTSTPRRSVSVTSSTNTLKDSYTTSRCTMGATVLTAGALITAAS